MVLLAVAVAGVAARSIGETEKVESSECRYIELSPKRSAPRSNARTPKVKSTNWFHFNLCFCFVRRDKKFVLKDEK